MRSVLAAHPETGDVFGVVPATGRLVGFSPQRGTVLFDVPLLDAADGGEAPVLAEYLGLADAVCVVFTQTLVTFTPATGEVGAPNLRAHTLPHPDPPCRATCARRSSASAWCPTA